MRPYVVGGHQSAVPIAQVEEHQIRDVGVQNLGQLENLRKTVENLPKRDLFRFHGKLLDGSGVGFIPGEQNGAEHSLLFATPETAPYLGNRPVIAIL